MTPLLYEKVNDEIVAACGFGCQSDWARNLQDDPNAQVLFRMRTLSVIAEMIADAEAIYDFIELHLKGHPLMVGVLYSAFQMDALQARSRRPASLLKGVGNGGVVG